MILFFFFFFQAEDGIRDLYVTGVQTCALPICRHPGPQGQLTPASWASPRAGHAGNLADRRASGHLRSPLGVINRRPAEGPCRRVNGPMPCAAAANLSRSRRLRLADGSDRLPAAAQPARRSAWSKPSTATVVRLWWTGRGRPVPTTRVSQGDRSWGTGSRRRGSHSLGTEWRSSGSHLLRGLLPVVCRGVDELDLAGPGSVQVRAARSEVDREPGEFLA